MVDLPKVNPSLMAVLVADLSSMVRFLPQHFRSRKDVKVLNGFRKVSFRAENRVEWAGDGPVGGC